MVALRSHAIYCSRSCKETAARRRRRVPLPSSKGCGWCGESFKPSSHVQRFCSPRCRYADRDARPEVRERNNAQHRARYVATPRRPRSLCSVGDCGSVSLARSLCYRHYRAARRAEGVEWAIGGDNKRRAARHGVEYEPINRLRVFERDGWVCGICGDPVAREDASLDHIVPMSLGGPHLYPNVQCSHLLCNVRKAASLPEGAVATP